MRLTRVLVCAALMASSLIMPVGAWDKYSFVGDDVYFSGQDSVIPALPVMEEELSSSSVSNIEFFNLLSPDFDSLAALIHVHHPEKPGGSVGSVVIPDIPAWDELRSAPAKGSSFQVNRVDSTYLILQCKTGAVDFEQNLNNGEFEGVAGIITEPYSGSIWNNSFDFSFDISSFQSFSAFSLSGSFTARGELGSSSYSLPADYLQLFVNDRLVHTFYGDSSGRFDFQDYIYSGSSSVISIRFSLHIPERYFSLTSAPYLNVQFILSPSSGSFIRFDLLNGESILDGQVDDAQDQINDWDSIESEFGSDATEGFNGLDLDNFTYPSDFLAAFSLVSGIFTDLWNCMGDFQIIYLLPLTLGICLLLVGRVSRSSVPSPPPLHTDLPVSNSLGPPSRPALKGGKR